MSTAPQAPQPAGAPTRFRCTCGRSVVAPLDSRAAETQRCSRCRTRRAHDEVPLHRTDAASQDFVTGS